MLRTQNLKVLAGGTDVFPSAQQGQMPRALLDVTRIDELKSISQSNGFIRIGAAATWSEIAKSNLPLAFDALKSAALEVGSLQIQNAGTIAGNICNASPAADGVPPLLSLDAKVELSSAERGVRILELADFITGVRKTTLSNDELLTAVLIPNPPTGERSAFEKLGSRRYMVISICMTSANILLDELGSISKARIAVGSCSAVAQRLRLLEKDIIGKYPTDVIVKPKHLSLLSPIDDIRGTGVYRHEAAQEQCRRAILRAGAV